MKKYFSLLCYLYRQLRSLPGSLRMHYTKMIFLWGIYILRICKFILSWGKENIGKQECNIIMMFLDDDAGKDNFGHCIFLAAETYIA